MINRIQCLIVELENREPLITGELFYTVKRYACLYVDMLHQNTSLLPTVKLGVSTVRALADLSMAFSVTIIGPFERENMTSGAAPNEMEFYSCRLSCCSRKNDASTCWTRRRSSNGKRSGFCSVADRTRFIIYQSPDLSITLRADPAVPKLAVPCICIRIRPRICSVALL